MMKKIFQTPNSFFFTLKLLLISCLQYDSDWNSLIRDAEKEDRQVTRKVRSVEEFPTIIQQCCFKPKFQPTVRKHLASKPGRF